MDSLGYIFGGILAGLRQIGDSRMAAACDVIHSSICLDVAIEQQKSQIKSTIVTLAAAGLGLAILNSVMESRKSLYYA